MNSQYEITVTADFHLNLNNRIDDYIKSLDQIASIANNGKLLLILGDIYHQRRPHPVEMNVFRDFVNSVKVPIVMIPGNHDMNLDASTIDEFYKFKINNVKLFKPPYILKYKNLSLYLDHGIVEGAKLGPADITLNLRNARAQSEILNTKADFYLFGDIHKAQVVRYQPPILYPGSIERVDFAERNEDKYVLIINTETRKYGYKKLIVRPMVQLEVRLAEIKSPIDFEIAFSPLVNDAIVKVKVVGTKEQLYSFNEAPLRDVLNKSFKYKITYEKIKDKRVRNKNISESKSTGDCFIEYASIKKLDKYIVEKGLEVINECS